MKFWVSLVKPKNRLDLVAGLCDGILTALTLTAGRMLNPGPPMAPDLALRVAAAAAVSGAFVFFVAHYAELRGELVEAEKQLNLRPHGRHVTSRLGRAVLLDAAEAAAIASGCSFCGALLPLGFGVFLPAPGWLAVVVALAVLALLGIFLARTVHGSPFNWAVGLLAGGAILTCAGAWLHLI
jgi:VIT1/CCC1 family predicted Fe2+/Mn2+ transporter